MFGLQAFLPLVALAAIAAAAPLEARAQLDFVLNPVTASDQRVPSASHSLSFNVTNDNPFFEFGGGESATCSLFWTTPSPPTCFTQCTASTTNGGDYFFRITPSTFSSASSFSVDITQVFVYELVNKNNATVAVTEGQGGYACSRGGQSTQCRILEGEGNGFTQPATTFFGEGEPDPRC